MVTGASSGLGFAIAKVFLEAGFDVAGVARNTAKLEESAARLAEFSGKSAKGRFFPFAADVTVASSIVQLFGQVEEQLGQVDVLVNCVGQSDRGTMAALDPARLEQHFRTNVTSVLNCSQAALPFLRQSRGVVVNIGSLASKVGAKYLGAYPTTKHALAGMTQQMRLEWKDFGVHVALVCPGPIRRCDAGVRYQAASVDDGEQLPATALQPGGGTRVRGLGAEEVAKAVLRAALRRSPDVLLPRYVRCLIVIGHLSPRLGDWLIGKFSKQ